VAKRLIGSGCRLGWRVGSVEVGVLDGVDIVEGKGKFGGKSGASYCNQRGGTLWHSYSLP